MALLAVNCPQCEAPLALAAAQRHCQCAHCGSKFVVDWSVVGSAELLRFESLVAGERDESSTRAAQMRLTELEIVIDQAEREVEAKHGQLEEAKQAYLVQKAQAQSRICRPQAWTYVTGLLAFVALFLGWFALTGRAWFAGMATAVVLLVAGWAFHSKWMAAEFWAEGELQQVRRSIDRAEAELSEAYVRLEDHMLERELREREVSGR